MKGDRMAFSQRHMRLMLDGPTRFWTYFTDDTATKVSIRGYFEEFRSALSVGDWIFATTSTGGTILHVEEIDPLELGHPR